MSDPSTTTVQVENWLVRLRSGEEAARNALLAQACHRLQRLSAHMLRSYPNVGRWEQSEDVLQNALVRLDRALKAKSPDSARHFFNLAALEIRRELLDLAKRYCGPLGQATKHDTVAPGVDGVALLNNVPDATGDSSEPVTVEQWATFHQEVELLPEEEREVFNLMWYEGLTRSEAASVLEISERTVARRWSSGRLKIHRTLHRQLRDQSS